jgi:hypothetical protein
MGFHPVTQEIARALNARRSPPPPFVPALAKEQLRRFANVVFQNPARREIAEGLLVLAIRLDVLGFGGPRDQLLVLAGCGLSAVEITDALVRRHAAESGAHRLMEKARSTTATPMEQALSRGRGTSSRGVGVRSGPPSTPRPMPRKPEGHRADEVTEVTSPRGRPDLPPDRDPSRTRR